MKLAFKGRFCCMLRLFEPGNFPCNLFFFSTRIWLLFFSVFVFLLHLTSSACFGVHLLRCLLLFDSGTDSIFTKHGCGSLHHWSDLPITVNFTSTNDNVSTNNNGFVFSTNNNWPCGTTIHDWFSISTDTNLTNNSPINVGLCSTNCNGFGFNQSHNRSPVSQQ